MPTYRNYKPIAKMRVRDEKEVSPERKELLNQLKALNYTASERQLSRMPDEILKDIIAKLKRG